MMYKSPIEIIYSSIEVQGKTEMKEKENIQGNDPALRRTVLRQRNHRKRHMEFHTR